MFNLVENELRAGSQLERFFQVEQAETPAGFLAQGQQDVAVVGEVGDDQLGAEGQSPER
jgi:hypothetical protein